jgi:hypothetical protein
MSLSKVKETQSVSACADEAKNPRIRNKPKRKNRIAIVSRQGSAEPIVDKDYPASCNAN